MLELYNVALVAFEKRETPDKTRVSEIITYTKENKCSFLYVIIMN
jgi:hypothetical protein